MGEKGFLKEITDLSGHYKPSGENVLFAMACLEIQGVDLSKVMYRSFEDKAYRDDEYFKSEGICEPISE